MFYKLNKIISYSNISLIILMTETKPVYTFFKANLRKLKDILKILNFTEKNIKRYFLQNKNNQ